MCFDDEEYKVVDDESKLGDVVMPILGVVNESYALLGTCFAISRTGLVVTAKHVLNDVLGEGWERTSTPEGLVYVLMERSDIEPPEPGAISGAKLPVKEVCPSLDSDLAVLKVKVPRYGGSHILLSRLRLGMKPPSAGQTCCTIGFPKMELTEEDGAIIYERPMTASAGEISDIFLEGCGERLRFPLFRCTAGGYGGLSGGPVWADDGRLVGVFSSSMSPETHLAHHALTAAIMDITVPRPNGSDATIRELAQAGAVLVGT